MIVEAIIYCMLFTLVMFLPKILDEPHISERIKND